MTTRAALPPGREVFAFLGLGSNIEDRLDHLQAGVGHFGVFSGRRWEGQVYPVVRSFIAANS